MEIRNILDSKEWFEVLQTTDRSQTAIMRLSPGKKSSEEPSIHKKSDQILLLLEGKLQAEIAEENLALKEGDICVVPAGTRHRFINSGQKQAVTFNVYAPPEYTPHEKG